jgi:hypothetical protein
MAWSGLNHGQGESAASAGRLSGQGSSRRTEVCNIDRPQRQQRPAR